MVMEFGKRDSNTIMMTALELVDITMIANLIKMIITGSYTSFVNKFHKAPGEKVSSGMLKVKMSTSLVGSHSNSLITNISIREFYRMGNFKKAIMHSWNIFGWIINSHDNRILSRKSRITS